MLKGLSANYQAKWKEERSRFRDIMQKYDKRLGVFETAKKMVKTFQDITEEQCVRILAVSNEYCLGKL